MRYPKVESVTPIMDLADMLRRGVLFSEAHIRTPPKKEAPKMSTPKQKYANAGLGQSRILDNSSNNSNNNSNYGSQGQGQSSPVPAWLLSNPLIPSINTSVTKM